MKEIICILPPNVKQMKKIFQDVCGERLVPGYEYRTIVFDKWFSLRLNC